MASGSAVKPTRRMHTVPKHYLSAFAVSDQERRTPGVWRFDRTGRAAVLGVNDTEVVTDFYSMRNDDGSRDIGIEEILKDIEDKFYDARQAILKQAPMTKEHRSALSKFIAAQLLRTPRFFQSMRDFLTGQGDAFEEDPLRIAMLELIQRWIPRLTKMNCILAHSEVDAPPLLTSDNPAVTWKKSEDGFKIGVDQFDPALVISCPLAPNLVFTAYQTPRSLAAVRAERHDIARDDRPSATFSTHIDIGGLPKKEVRLLNQICVANAHQHVYASYRDDPLDRFLQNRFFDKLALACAHDLKLNPVGSPMAPHV